MREETLEVGEYYHVYNRGVDKRIITLDERDSERFVKGLSEFNNIDRIGSIFKNSFRKRKEVLRHTVTQLVEVVAYCLNPNHFHLILKQLVENGISIFLKSQCGGYSRYFNIRYARTGSLFEGRFKTSWISDVDTLLYKSVYVNLNDKVHKISGDNARLVRSSWKEYERGESGICITETVLREFPSVAVYVNYADKCLDEMWEAKAEAKELEKIEFED